MKAYRIAGSRYSDDLSGEGARLYGGRWNRKGISMIYCSEHESLAALEVLVHLSSASAPPDLKLLVLNVPDSVSVELLKVAKLPNEWRSYPAPSKLAEIGTEWVLSKRSLLLKVPSVLAPSEYNILINPLHPEFKKIKVVEHRDFKFDHRLTP